MKAKQLLVNIVLLMCVLPASAQGTLTFIYDQQTGTEAQALEGGPSSIKSEQPVGQSFTPALPSVGFVRFFLQDRSATHDQAAVVEMLLRSDSITGPILGTSDTLALPANSGDYYNFFFSAPVSVIPGTTYYFQPFLLSGDHGMAGEFVTDYQGGTEFDQGNVFTGRDLWFREGIVVPEPSTWALLLMGGGALMVRRWRR